jgi:hypothetical protein
LCRGEERSDENTGDHTRHCRANGDKTHGTKNS